MIHDEKRAERLRQMLERHAARFPLARPFDWNHENDCPRHTFALSKCTCKDAPS